MEDSGQFHILAALLPAKEHRVPIGTGLEDTKEYKFMILPELELRPLCRSARSQSLYYRLPYLEMKAKRVGDGNCFEI
jgi:hypothetical protein